MANPEYPPKKEKMADTEYPKLERYEILGELGEGGMGKVYRAREKELTKRTVALKVIGGLTAGLTARDQDVARFQQEIVAIGKLDHPNIVKLYVAGYDESSRQHFYTMELIEGCSLQQFIQDNLPKSAKGPKSRSGEYYGQVVDIMIKVGGAIQYAHQKSIIHRDLKPANIMLNAEREAKVMDFGFAQFQSENTSGAKSRTKSRSRTEGPVGTLLYMSPEQAAGKSREVDERSDVYALGAILYEMLSGQPPLIGKNPYEILQKIRHEEPMPPSRLKSGIPKDLDSICMKALAKDKQSRYGSAALFTGDLCRYSRGEPIMARPIGTLGLWWKQINNHKMAAGIGGCAMLLLAFGIWLAFAIPEYREQSVQQKQRDTIMTKTLRFEKEMPTAESLRNKYSKSKMYQKIGVQEQEDRQRVIDQCQSAIDELSTIRLVSSKNDPVAQILYKISRNAAEIALDGRSYLLAELFAEVCQEAGYEKEAIEFRKRIAEREKQVQSQQIHRVEEIMTELARQLPEQGMVDTYVTEIVRMNGSHTVEKLLEYVNGNYEWQRRVSIEALGKLRDNHTRKEGHDAVEWLLSRLEKLNLAKDEAEIEDIVWALGRLRDRRADALVRKIRYQAGSDSTFWERTKIPYSWLPVQNLGVSEIPKNGSISEIAKNGSISEIAKNGSSGASEIAKRGLMKYEKRDLEGAIEDCSQAIRLDPKCANAYNTRGLARKAKGDIKAAMEDFHEAIRLDSTFVEAYNNRAMAREDGGDLDGAISDYTQAIRLDPRYTTAYNNRGVVRYNKKDMKGAIEDYNEAIRLNAAYAGAYSNRANARFALKDVKGAIEDYNEAIRLNPRDIDAHINRGAVRESIGDLDGALSDCSEAIKLNPRCATSYTNRGNLRYTKGDFAGAIEDYTQAIQLDSKDIPAAATAYNNRGSARRAMGNIDAALKDYTQAIRLDPKDASIYSNRGSAWYQKEELDKSLQDCNEAIKIDPRYAEAYVNRGNILYDKGDFENAVADYSQALKLNPRLAEAYNNRGNIRCDQGDLESAMRDYNKALSINPKYDYAYVNRGEIYDRRGDSANAMKDYRRALDLNPDLIETYKNRANLFRKKGIHHRAAVYFRKYLKLCPTAPDAPKIRQYIDRQTKKKP